MIILSDILKITNLSIHFMVVFLFRSLFVSFYVILSSFISHIARYVPSSTYKSTYERRTKINSTYFLERPFSKKLFDKLAYIKKKA